jgi:hypothetical protein
VNYISIKLLLKNEASKKEVSGKKCGNQQGIFSGTEAGKVRRAGNEEQ